MENQNKTTLAHYWIKKAKRSAEAAARELHSNNEDFCANRLYYAAFYAVSAALIMKGLVFKKHSAVKAAFHKEFIKNNIIPQKYGALYNKLLRDREDADYIAFVLFEQDVLKQEIEDVTELIKLMGEYICSYGEENS